MFKSTTPSSLRVEKGITPEVGINFFHYSWSVSNPVSTVGGVWEPRIDVRGPVPQPSTDGPPLTGQITSLGLFEAHFEQTVLVVVFACAVGFVIASMLVISRYA